MAQHHKVFAPPLLIEKAAIYVSSKSQPRGDSRFSSAQNARPKTIAR
jgi:hypothetical protein